jgi:hypothetical protein
MAQKQLTDDQISDLYNSYGQGMQPIDFIKLVKTIEMYINDQN